MKKLTRAHKMMLSGVLGFIGTSVVAFVFLLPSLSHKEVALVSSASSIAWSEQIGEGEMFAACASTLPTGPGTCGTASFSCVNGVSLANTSYLDSHTTWYCTADTISPLCTYYPPAPVNGTCNMSAANSCYSGTLGANAIQPDGSYQWYCNGLNGGAMSGLCWYVPPKPINGTCNMSAANSCYSGTLGVNARQPDGSYQWYCNGLNGGAMSGLCWYVPAAVSCAAYYGTDSGVTGACSFLLNAPVTASGGSYTSTNVTSPSGYTGTDSWKCSNGTWSRAGYTCNAPYVPPPTGTAGACGAAANTCASGVLGSNAGQPPGMTEWWYCNSTNGGATSPICWSFGAAATCPAATYSSCSLPQTFTEAYANGTCVAPTTGNCQYYCRTEGYWETYIGFPTMIGQKPAVNNCKVPAIGAPSVTIGASPSSVLVGSRSTLSWSVTNATSCTTSANWSTGGKFSGSGLTDPLSANTTFTLQCTGPGGTSPMQSVTVFTTSPASCTAPWGSTIASGVSVTAFQSASVTYPATCASQTRTCTNGSLSGSYTNASCTVITPTIGSFGATPTRVRSGGTTTVSWDTTMTTSCAVTRNGAAWKMGTASTGVADTITSQTVYTLTCDALPPQSVTVNVVPGYQEF